MRAYYVYKFVGDEKEHKSSLMDFEEALNSQRKFIDENKDILDMCKFKVNLGRVIKDMKGINYGV